MESIGLTSEQLKENKRLTEIWGEIINTCNNKDPEYSYNLFWETVNDARQENDANCVEDET